MVKPSASALPPSLPPMGLSRVMAAEFVGVSPSKFDEMVRDGRMPRPRRIDARRIWLRPELEAAMLDLPVEGKEANSRDGEWDVVDFQAEVGPPRIEISGWDRTLLLSLYRAGGTAPASTLEGAGPVSRKRLSDRGLITDDGETLAISPEGATIAKRFGGIYRVAPVPPPAKAMLRAAKAAPPNPNPDLDSELIPYRFVVGHSEKKLASKLGLLEMKVLRQLHPFDGARNNRYDILGAGHSTTGLLYARGFIEEFGKGRDTWLAITDAGKKAYEKQRL